MSPISLLQYEVRGFLLLLGVLLVYRALTGQIALRGLLSDKSGAQSLSPARVQLLLATLAVSFQYVVQVAHGDGAVMPDINSKWLILFGGSSGIYAAMKAKKFWALSRKSR